MKTPFVLPILALAAGCMADRPVPIAAPSEARLAEALGGRVQAGPPQRCVSQRNLGGNRSVGQGAIIFGTGGSDLVYLNRPPAGCPVIRPGMAIRTRTTTNQLCSGDIVDVFDPLTGFGAGSCGLGEFTPYRRAR